MDKEKFWDIAEVLSKAEVYHDWEGMSSGEGLEEKVKKAVDVVRGPDDTKEHIEMVSDLLLHFLYEARDQADMEFTEAQVVDFAWIICEMVTTRHWMKSGYKW